MSRRPPSGRHVRFDLPPSSRSPPRSILRPPPPQYRRPSSPHSSERRPYSSSRHSSSPGPSSPPTATRRSSLPDMRHSSRLMNERRMHALESLHDMRSYLKEACNFHGEDSRRAISALSIDALSALISFVNALRADMDTDMDTTPTKRDEKLLRSMVDATLRHPHEQLAPPESSTMGKYERNCRRAHKKRMRREADFRLVQFASKQLHIPIRVLRELPPRELEQRELDAFKARLQRFNAREGSTGYSSAPSSPAERRMTIPHSPHTDPMGVRKAFEMPGLTKDELFPDMEELSLPGSSFDLGKMEGATQTTAARTPTTVPKERPFAGPVHGAPYGSPYGSPYAAPGAPPVGGSPYHSPYGGVTPSPYAGGNSSYAGAGPSTSQAPGTPTQTYAQPVYGTPTQGYAAQGYKPGTPTQGYANQSYTPGTPTQTSANAPVQIVTNYPGTPPPPPVPTSYPQGGWHGNNGAPNTKVQGANIENTRR